MILLPISGLGMPSSPGLQVFPFPIQSKPIVHASTIVRIEFHVRNCVRRSLDSLIVETVTLSPIIAPWPNPILILRSAPRGTEFPPARRIITCVDQRDHCGSSYIVIIVSHSRRIGSSGSAILSLIFRVGRTTPLTARISLSVVRVLLLMVLPMGLRSAMRVWIARDCERYDCLSAPRCRCLVMLIAVRWGVGLFSGIRRLDYASNYLYRNKNMAKSCGTLVVEV